MGAEFSNARNARKRKTEKDREEKENESSHFEGDILILLKGLDIDLLELHNGLEVNIRAFRDFFLFEEGREEKIESVMVQRTLLSLLVLGLSARAS